MTKKVLTATAIVVLAAAIGWSMTKLNKENGSPETPVTTGNVTAAQERTEPLVTLIELGSVRCMPCKMMQPILEEVEKEYQGQVRVIFYDVWTPEGQPYGAKYGIRAIPTQVFLDRDGKEYFRHAGYFPKEELVKILKQQGVK